MQTQYTIEASGLKKQYRLPGETINALKGIDLALQPGEFVCIMGHSGAGKTTLLNILGLLDDPTSGELKLGNKSVSSKNNSDKYRRDYIGFIFQDFYLIPSLNARENISLPSAFGVPSDDADQLLQLVGLENRKKHYPKELSGGEMQRVAIARALYGKPKLILADEPTGNLDTKNSGLIFDLLRKLAREQNVAVLAATHNKRLAQKADRIINLEAGNITSEEVM